NLAGSFNGYFDNIHFTNAYGVVLKDLYSSNGVLGLTGSPSQSSTKFNGAGAATALSNVVAAVGSLSLAAAPASATVGQTITLTATLDDAAAAGIPYANLELAANRAQDQVSATQGRTNASGNLTITVTSLVAGASGASVAGGPFSASASYTFVAAAPLSWSVGTAGQTLVIGPGSTALSVEAVDAYGNLTSSARIVKVSVADANLQLSLDNSTWTGASTGVTLSPGVGVGTVYARISSGGYRSNTLQASDAGGSGAVLAAGSAPVIINPSAAASVRLSLAASGVAGIPLALSATALDLSSQAANSNATLSFSATNPSASFSTDSGNTWNSSASVALANGFASLLYRDTAAGVSGLSVSSTLGPASTSTTIVAGAPALISGTASPDNIYNSASAGTPKTSTLSGFVFDAYGNPVSNTAVTFFLITAQGSLTSNPVSVNSNSSGAASTVYTAGAATAANYIRVSAAGLKPWLLNVQATTPTKLNLSPNPATAGVSVPVQFTLLAQDAASPAITGYSTTSVLLNSNSGNVQFSSSASGPWSQPSLVVNLSAGTAVVYAMVASPSYETITATDQAGAGALTAGTANLYVPQASLALLAVSSPQLNVSRGQAGCTLVYTVQNSGGDDTDL
ncbi:MAG TPA: hypothetical protein VNZ67_11950, partial [bacterium]|nr:hypothetical protein [bacterium]